MSCVCRTSLHTHTTHTRGQARAETSHTHAGDVRTQWQHASTHARRTEVGGARTHASTGFPWNRFSGRASACIFLCVCVLLSWGASGECVCVCVGGSDAHTRVPGSDRVCLRRLFSSCCQHRNNSSSERCARFQWFDTRMPTKSCWHVTKGPCRARPTQKLWHRTPTIWFMLTSCALVVIVPC